jgi:hypothetical protein
MVDQKIKAISHSVITKFIKKNREPTTLNLEPLNLRTIINCYFLTVEP